MIKVLIVDDSSFIRRALLDILSKDTEIEVVGTAANGLDALEAVKKLDPDVVTMDIEMPKMDGVTALQHIMRDMPRPVLMVSSLTSEGAEITLKAMEAGALDFVAKGGMGAFTPALGQELIQKVKAVSRRRKALALRAQFRQAAAQAAVTQTHHLSSGGRDVLRPQSRRQTRDLVAIGVSTGGPPAVQKVLTALPEDFPAPILIAQHMPATFTGPFAARLDGMCKISVKEAEDGEKARDGWAYVCPGGRHLRAIAKLNQRTLVVSDEPKSAIYKPSASELMGSVGEQFGNRAVGVILTGMGSDGCTGVEILKKRGGRALAQSEASCVVYGMPKAIVDAGLADEILELDDIAAGIMDNLYK
ncbi:MAG: chemotaxis response regulator protein-glutamate methylesterase [Deltaproteobacteria bacterium]|jgi:two-component system chemotaxis response regulator CheB|nr:chemotaxis response regulator protein-glutamate methylesterase [Deltaproteobacteria bacterium]